MSNFFDSAGKHRDDSSASSDNMDESKIASEPQNDPPPLSDNMDDRQRDDFLNDADEHRDDLHSLSDSMDDWQRDNFFSDTGELREDVLRDFIEKFNIPNSFVEDWIRPILNGSRSVILALRIALCNCKPGERLECQHRLLIRLTPPNCSVFALNINTAIRTLAHMDGTNSMADALQKLANDNFIFLSSKEMNVILDVIRKICQTTPLGEINSLQDLRQGKPKANSWAHHDFNLSNSALRFLIAALALVPDLEAYVNFEDNNSQMRISCCRVSNGVKAFKRPKKAVYSICNTEDINSQIPHRNWARGIGVCNDNIFTVSQAELTNPTPQQPLDWQQYRQRYIQK
jgi:hypothetical protein